MNGKGVIKLICAYQMNEIRKVRKLNKGRSKLDRIKPETKCRACFKAIMRPQIETVNQAKTGIRKLDERDELSAVMSAKGGYSECTV